MDAIWERWKLAIIGGAIALAVILSSFIVVPETMQAVIVRTGEPVRVANRFRPNADFGSTGAGVVPRIPILERVVWVSKQVMDVDMQRRLWALLRRRSGNQVPAPLLPLPPRLRHAY